MAASLGAAVGTLGTVLFYGTATINLVWQGMGWKWLEKGDLHKLYLVNNVLPWIGHIVCSFLPTFIITMGGTAMVDLMKTYMPMDGIAMKTLFTVGSLLLPSVSPSCSSRSSPSRRTSSRSSSASPCPLSWDAT